MRKRSKVSTQAASGNTDQEQNFWPSYADMMSSFALILFFLMLLAYLSNIKTGNNLRNTEERLSDTLSVLLNTQAQVNEANAELQDAQNALSEKESELSEKENELNEKDTILATVQVRLDAANAELANSQFVLMQLKDKIDAQAQYVESAQVELEKMHGQMEMIVGVRREILDQIMASYEDVSGGTSKASIGENGNIILNDTVFFDIGQSELKAESFPVLNQLISVFSQFLSSTENSRYIDSIIISGHTDSTGSAETNRVLSTDRANAVLSYIVTETPLAQYTDYFCAAGYGASRPIADNDTPEGRAQNRRIEISITLKDDTVMDIVNTYLEMDVPDVTMVDPATTE